MRNTRNKEVTIHNMNKTELEFSGGLIPEFMLLNTILVTKADLSTFTFFTFIYIYNIKSRNTYYFWWSHKSHKPLGAN